MGAADIALVPAAPVDALVRAPLATVATEDVTCRAACALTISGDVMRATTTTARIAATLRPMSASVRYVAGPALSGGCELAEEIWERTAY
jgi:hypothetical protein